MAVMVFGFPFESDSRIWSEEVTCQVDCNRTLIFLADTAGSSFDLVLSGLWFGGCMFGSFSHGIHHVQPLQPLSAVTFCFEIYKRY